MLKGFYTTLLCLGAISFSSWSYAAAKVALIIGNSEYKTVADNLKNPVNDAKAIQKILQADGYKTHLVLNADLDKFLAALDKIQSDVDVGGKVVFYYSGHGIQSEGQNFLVPTNAQLLSKDKVSREAVSLQEITEKLQTTGAASKILIIDACRNDPFPKKYRSATKGLARMQPTERALMIMYAASPGEVAEDGKGRNGTFTSALLEELNKPKQKLTELMDNVVDKVRISTANKQNPYYEGTGLSKIKIIDGEEEPVLPVLPIPSVSPMIGGLGGEDIFWQSIVNSQDIEDFQEYLRRYPSGNYAFLAEKRIKQFELAQENKVWQGVLANLNEMALEDFMQKFPNSLFVAEATIKLADLRLAKQQKLDEDLWQKIKNSTRPQDFEAYLNDFPTGKYTVQAKQLAAQYKKVFELEERAWRLIESSTNPSDFEKYLRLYPTGTYSQLAQEKIHNLQAALLKQQELKAKDEELWKQTKTIWTLASLQKYVSSFPNGLYAQEAKQAIQELKQKESDKLSQDKDRALWQKVSNSKDPKDFILYLSLYPDGMYASLAKKQQEKIEAEQLKTLDEQTWNSIKDKENIQLFRDYIKDFTNGMYTSDARKQIKKLADLLVTKQEEEQWQAIKDKTEAKLFADYLIAFPKGKYAEQAQVLLAKYTTLVTNTVANIKTIRDCIDCPQMVIIPKGSFLMGDKLQHLVTINKSLAVAKYELTIAEYNLCVKENACYKPPKSFNQNDQHPVSGLRWQDAKNYINWLSHKAKRVYRLPTEAEWEYFARAGTKTTWGFSDDPVDICQYANTADESYNRVFSNGDNYCNDTQANHASVGSYKPNAFGLYDTIGNVYEWVEDCFVDSYAAAPTDGSAVLNANCDKRVLRGGAYAVSAHKATAASRLAADPNDAFYLNGVRLVRDVKEGEN